MTLDQMKEIQEKYNVRILYITKSGSQLYGTNDENSDTDYKGIFVQNPGYLVTKTDIDYIKLDTNKSGEANTSSDIDIHLDSLQKWASLLKKGETGAIDTLFSMWHIPSTIFSDPMFTSYVRLNYKSLISSNSHAFLGYCISQSQKYGIKGARYKELKDFIEELKSLKQTDTVKSYSTYLSDLVVTNYKYINFVTAPGPRGSTDDWIYLDILGRKFADNTTISYILDNMTKIEEDYGHRSKKATSSIDWKAISHAVRVLTEIQELLTKGMITFPLKNASTIYKIKKGQLDIEKVTAFIEKGVETTDTLLKLTKLPKKVSDKAINDLILSQYRTKNGNK